MNKKATYLGSCVCLFAFLTTVGADQKADWEAAIKAANPLHWYKFEETGADCLDAGSGALKGKYEDVQPAQEGLLGPTSAAVFTRTGANRAFFAGAANLTGTWTAEYIVKTTKAPAGSDSQVLHDSATTSIRLAGWTSLGELGFTSYGVADYQFTPSAGMTLRDLVIQQDQWVHLVWRNKNGMQMFLNGELVGTSSSAVDLPRLAIGGRGAGPADMLQGVLDEAVVYNRALSDQDIIGHASLVGLAPVQARNPNPANGTIGVTAPLLQWRPGVNAAFHNVYFGTTPDLTEANLVAPRSFMTIYYHIPGLTPGVKYYWRVDEISAAGTVAVGNVWWFIAEPVKAFLPSPADGAAGVLPGVILNWSKGKAATGQHVFFGPDETAVANGDPAVDMGTITETTFNTGALRASTTYFWRVDTVKSGNAVEKGDVWRFSTVDGGPANKIRWEWWSNISGTAVIDLTGNPDYPANPTGSEYVDLFQSAVDWADNYGQRLYGWLKPPDTADFTFWIAGDDAQELWLSKNGNPADAELVASVPGWTPAFDWDNTGGGAGGPGQKSAPIALQAGQKYFIMALGKEGGGGDSTAVAWQGGSITARAVIKAEYVDVVNLLPLQAFGPLPANDAVDVIQTPTLTWNAGEKATKHNVYFGDDANAVAAADTSSNLFKGSVTDTSYDAGALEWGKTFWWRIDETDGAEVWKGNVWKFTTANFIPVDDFESYNDQEDQGTRIYETWSDGYSDGSSGSIVGNMDPPFAEQTIVHGGKQSMPMDYNNVNSPYYSEAYREFSPLLNWTGNGLTDLSLWVRGNPIRMVEDPPGQYTITAQAGDVWGTSDNFRFVYKTLTGDGAISAKVVSVTRTSVWAKAGVMIRDTLDPGSSYVFMFPTPDGRRAFQNRPDVGAGAVSAHSDVSLVTLPFWVKVERKGNQFTGYYSPDGKTWTKQPDTENTGTDRSPNPQAIAMGNSVCLGLAVTSNNAAALCTAVFSDVVVTGAASFQVADVGSVSPSNDTAPLYLTVEDSAGKKATVVDPNAAAVNALTWTEWKVPLTDLKGVNLTKVKKLYIGVGNKQNPVPDGYGRIYVDDIRVVKP